LVSESMPQWKDEDVTTRNPTVPKTPTEQELSTPREKSLNDADPFVSARTPLRNAHSQSTTFSSPGDHDRSLSPAASTNTTITPRCWGADRSSSQTNVRTPDNSPKGAEWDNLSEVSFDLPTRKSTTCQQTSAALNVLGPAPSRRPGIAPRTPVASRISSSPARNRPVVSKRSGRKSLSRAADAISERMMPALIAGCAYGFAGEPSSSRRVGMIVPRYPVLPPRPRTPGKSVSPSPPTLRRQKPTTLGRTADRFSPPPSPIQPLSDCGHTRSIQPQDARGVLSAARPRQTCKRPAFQNRKVRQSGTSLSKRILNSPQAIQQPVNGIQ